MEPQKNELPNEGNCQKLKLKKDDFDWQRNEGITIKEVQASEGLTHLSDEQAEEVIDFIETYCMLVFSLHQKQLHDNKQEDESNNEFKNEAA